MKKRSAAAISALLAAALYAVNIPLSKLLLRHVSPTMLAAFLYLGAGAGLLLCRLAGRGMGRPAPANPLTRKELPWILAMVVLDIAAPILLMMGVARTNSSTVSLLSSFEIVATSLIALAVFREALSRRLWAAIALVTAASALLGWEGSGLVFNRGALLVLGACVCWGFENNCTRMLSARSAVETVTIKGCCSGAGSLAVALTLGEPLPELVWLPVILLMGFVSYGLSITLYILAQRELGAAKTSAYYAVAPFLGAGFSVVLLGERPGLLFWEALAMMALSAFLTARDTILLQHTHPHTHEHTHPHRHGELLHTHAHAHEHTHLHVHREDEARHTHTHRDLPDHDHPHASRSASASGQISPSAREA